MASKTKEIVVEEPGTEIAKVDQPDTLMGLVRTAVERGAAIEVEVFERLVALQERVEARNAEMAMARALANFQRDCPPIGRVKTAEVKKNGVKAYEYHFAPLDEIMRVIRPHLTANGLSFVHDAKMTPTEITVICTLQHTDGAVRTATFSGPTDSSGGKNPIQMVASARSYGRRYTLMDVLGLTTEEDTDGNAPASVGPKVTDEQFNVLVKLKDEVGADVARFCAFLGVETLRDIPAARYEEAKAALEAKRGRR